MKNKTVLTVFTLVILSTVAAVPSIMTAELEKIDLRDNFEGTFGERGYIGTYSIINRSGVWQIPMHVEKHMYVKEVKGDNLILNLDVNMTRGDNGETIHEFSHNSTYVINRFTLENVVDAPEADKARVGYDPLYRPFLKPEEDIQNVWLDELNSTGTLQFIENIVDEGVTLHKYLVNETITKLLWIKDVSDYRNSTLTYTKIVLIEPLLGGLPVYTEIETFDWIVPQDTAILPWIHLTYRSTAEAKIQGLERARASLDMLNVFDMGVWNGVLCKVYIFSNSTISDFYFGRDDKLVSFGANGVSDTVGFCRVTIPIDLLCCDNPEQWTVLVNNMTVSYRAIEDGGCTHLYFNYSHSTKKVKIIGKRVGTMTGDINDDGIVDIFDVVLAALAFDSRLGDSNWNQAADLNNDDVVDIFDIVLLAKNFGKTT